MSLSRWILLALPQHLSSPPAFSEVRVARYLAFCVMFSRPLFVLFMVGVFTFWYTIKLYNHCCLKVILNNFTTHHHKINFPTSPQTQGIKRTLLKSSIALNEIYIMIIIISIQKGDTRSSKIKVIILNRINIKRSLENMTAGGIESPETHMIMNLLTPFKVCMKKITTALKGR